MTDVLIHAAVKENERLTQLESGGAAGVELASWESPIAGNQTPGAPTTGSGSDIEELCPVFVKCWEKQLTPLAVPRACGFKVCDTSGYYRCGSNCVFCVPAGVSKVLFQIWGPGGGTSTNCCCGGAPFGPSGAFYMTEINVVQGECYCMEGGCAYCCYAYQDTPGAEGQPMCLRSCSNDKVCVRVHSGVSCYCQWNIDATNALGFTQQQSGRFLPSSQGGCSAEMCSGWNFCFDSSNDVTCIPFIFGSCAWCADYGSGGAGKSFGYGIPSIWPFMKVASSLNNSCSVSPPVFGFENNTCVEIWSGSTCSGCCRCSQQGIQSGPGFGGYASQVFGGCQSCGGDSGGMGMVCVSYTCD